MAEGSTFKALPDMAAGAPADAEWVKKLLARETRTDIREQSVVQILQDARFRSGQRTVVMPIDRIVLNTGFAF